MYRLGWFSTGRGGGSRGLLTRMHQEIENGNVRAEIAFVFCSREPGDAEGSDQFIKLVKSYNLPLVCFSSKRFTASKGEYLSLPWRLEYDREAMKRLAGYNPDLCVLAGYMLIVGPEMCRRYNMINLHPALPGGPTGTWKEVIWKLIADKATDTGAMMHLVTPELDKGPPVTYCKFPIRGQLFDRHWEKITGLTAEQIKASQGEENPLFQLIRQEGVKRELPLVVTTVKAFAEGRLHIENGKVVDSDGKTIKAYSLTREINKIVKAA
jgi:folate-dependent phosphoribosylglycinamide formyltransferase PurN